MTQPSPIPFGKYFIFRKINKGGMAEIFLARAHDPDIGICVLKSLLPELAKKENFVNMFITEGKIAKLLEHPNVVRSYELGKFKNKYYIAMEYISGKDLHHIQKYFKKKGIRVPLPMGLHIISKVCGGLHYAHMLLDSTGVPLNLVNRDVSPTNIIMTFDGRIKIIDFGIAQTIIGFTSQIGRIKGKICYMSPEQVRGLPIDHRSDVFSAATVLYEMITGVDLYAEENEFNQMERVKKVDIEPPSKLNKKITPELEQVLMKALQADLNDRYQTAEEFGIALSQYASEHLKPSTQADLAKFMETAFHADHELERKKLGEIEYARLPAPTPGLPPTPHKSVELELDELEVAEDKPKRGFSVKLLLAAVVVLILIGIALIIVLINR